MAGRVYIICGGTGGHLAPGIATAQRFIERNIPVELIISEKEVDSRLLQAYPEIPYRRAKGAPFSWKPARFMAFFYKTILGFFQSVAILRKHRPAALLAFGGYLSISFALAARLLKIPVVLHEAHRKAGRSIRILSGMAEMVFVPDGMTLRRVPPRRLRHIGMPLRREIHHLPKDDIRQQMGIPLHAKVLAIVGGSQGAEVLNKWVERHRRSIASDGIWVFLVTGPGKQILPEVETFASDMGGQVEVRTFSFHNALHELFSASDLVISRAGAGTIAELVACLTPSILVPYPFAADQHQLANARDLERRGGCILIEQTQMNSLYRELLDLIYNDWLLGRLRANLRRLARDDAAMEICRFMETEFVNPGGSGTVANPAGKEVLLDGRAS